MRLTLIGAASVAIAILLAPNSYPSTVDLHLARQDRVDVRTDTDSDDNIKEDPSVTPLMRAARDGETKEFKSLLKRGSNINEKDAYGWTALVYAMKQNDFEMVKALVNRGADLSATDDAGLTVLMAAATKGETEVVKYLLEKGADVNARTENGVTVFTLLKLGGKPEIVELIKAAGGVEGGPMQPQRIKSEPNIDTRAVFLGYAPPLYTEEARHNRVQGNVIVRALIGIDGAVKKVRITRGLLDGLSEQAMISCYKGKFRPATKDGQPVESWVTLQVEFNLR